MLDGVDAAALLAELERERRAIRLRVGGEERYVAADEAGLYRDALGAVPPGRPAARRSSPTCPTRCASLVARYARTHGPFTTEELRARYGVDASAVLRELERDGRARPRRAAPGRQRSATGATSRSCAACAAPRWRRCARRSSRPTSARLAAFLPSWQGVDRHSARRRRDRPAARGARAAAGARAAGRDLGARRAAAAHRRLLADVARQPLRERRARVGRAPGALGALGAGGAVLPRGRAGDRPAGRRRPARAALAAGRRPSTSSCARAWREGPCFFTDLLAELDAPAEALREALWDLVWAGEATNDAWAPLRAPRLALARGERSAGARDVRGRAPSRPRSAAPASRARRAGAHGRDGRLGRRCRAAGRSPSRSSRRRRRAAAPERRRALAELLLERYGIVTREQVLAEGDQGRLRDALRQRSPTSRRSASAAAATSSRAWAARSSRCPAPSSGCARARAARAAGETERPRALVLAAADPAQPYGAALPWPRREGQQRRPARVAGAYVVLVDEQPALYVERGGRGLLLDRLAGDGSRLRASDRCAALRRSPRRCAPGASASSRSSASTASRRSPRRSSGRSSSSASTPVRAGSRSAPEAPLRAAAARLLGWPLRAMPFTCLMHAIGAGSTRPRRVGHKGAAHIEPGNTLASFDAALRHGVDMIELDVLCERADGSGRLLVAHDYEDMRRAHAAQLRAGARAPRGRGVRRHRARRRREAPRLRAARARGPARAELVERTLISGMFPAGLTRIRAAEPGAAPRLVGAAGAPRLHDRHAHRDPGARDAHRLPRDAAAPRPRGAAGRALRRDHGALARGVAARSCARWPRAAASSTCGRSTTRG